MKLKKRVVGQIILILLETIDLMSWAMSVFCSHAEFDRYHLEIGKSFNYVEMKTEMLHGLSLTPQAGIEIPDVDIGDISSGILEGLGDINFKCQVNY